MMRIRPAALAAALLPLTLLAPAATAQDVGSATEVTRLHLTDDSAAAPADTAPTKKKGGLFGKVKGIAKNKVVQQVAKTAACTMLPGGQVVAGAIDAAANKDAVGAAAGAATGTNCMPGMGGAGAAAGAAGTMAAGAMAGGGSALAMNAGMGAGSAEMMAAMQASMARMGQAGQMPVMPGMPQYPDTANLPGEAEGRPLELSADLVKELRKGRTAVRHIDWVVGSAALSATGGPLFAQAVGTLAAAMREAGGSYRLDLYLDERQEAGSAKSLGSQRLSTVQMAFLTGAGDDPKAVPQPGSVKRDDNPRLEIVRIK